MAQRMTTQMAADLLREVIASQDRAVAVAESVAQDARAEFVRRSEGTLSLADLRRMGHPFARRRPMPALADRATINDQGGGFKDAWEVDPVVVTGERISVKVVNRHPHAQWMHGTTRMVRRPIVAAVRLWALPILRQRLREMRESATRLP